MVRKIRILRANKLFPRHAQAHSIPTYIAFIRLKSIVMASFGAIRHLSVCNGGFETSVIYSM